MEQSDIEYLRDAFKDARKEIEGGVALSGFIGVRDTEQNVAAAMAGYNPTGESDYPLIFAGAQQGNVEYYGWTSNSYTHIYTQSATPNLYRSISPEDLVLHFLPISLYLLTYLYQV